MVLRPVYNSDNDKWVLNLYELERLLRQLDLQCAAANVVEDSPHDFEDDNKSEKG